MAVEASSFTRREQMCKESSRGLNLVPSGCGPGLNP